MTSTKVPAMRHYKLSCRWCVHPMVGIHIGSANPLLDC